MKFLADEGVDRQIVERLRVDGHDVAYIAELDPGISDEVILSQSRASGSVLLTADKDFGDLVFRQHHSTPGVLLVRLSGLTAAAKASVVSVAIREHASELSGAFAVLSAGSIRIRHALDI